MGDSARRRDAFFGIGVRSAHANDSGKPGNADLTCDEAIDVYTSRNAVPHDYYELAWISAEANSVYTSDNKIVDKIRKEAAEKGANAIIVNDFATTGSNAKVIGAELGGNTADTKTSALAIYMPDEASRVTLKCGQK